MILFVDDESRTMKSWVEELEESDYEVRFCNQVDDAFAFFRDHREQVDLLILDIMMPPGRILRDEDTERGLRSGVRFYETVREQAPSLPIIVLTNVSNPGVADRFAGDAYCQFLRKEDYFPFELAALVGRTIHTSREAQP